MDLPQTFPDQSTPRDLLNQFYLKYNLGKDGGINEPYVKIELYKSLAIYFPNFDSRRKAVLKHDIHHILTGYTSALKGETEISAWELASGCSNYLAAFVINLHGFMLGVPFNLRGIFNAFVKGRRTKNLYSDQFPNEIALDMKVGELRKLLLLDSYKEAKPGMMDFVMFTLFLFLGTINSFLSLLLLPIIVIFTLYMLIMPDKSPEVSGSVEN